jgi:hypothetical protein
VSRPDWKYVRPAVLVVLLISALNAYQAGGLWSVLGAGLAGLFVVIGWNQ